jgi:hypothetical protein
LCDSLAGVPAPAPHPRDAAADSAATRRPTTSSVGAALVKVSSHLRRAGNWAGGLLLLAACAASTGCQVDVAGQTMPSGYHLSDDVQYYAPDPEFKLSREAAALAEQRAAEVSEPQAP